MPQQQPAQPPTSLTPEAYQVAVMYRLGQPTAEYRPRFTIRKAIGLALLFASGPAFLLLALVSSSSIELSGVIALLILSGIGFVTPVWIVVDLVRSREMRVYVCPAGLLYHAQGTTTAIRWDQVEAFWQRVIRRYSYGISTGSTHRYTILRSDGVTFTFNDRLDHVEALGTTIARETARLLWPRYIASYQAGQTLSFGPISLNQQGVSNGKERLTWQQIKAITLTRGFLSIQQAGTTARKWNVQASKIPNINLFMTLVNSIVNRGRG
ncbi:MAG TPA: DUF6585 family protein [Ktedonobacteraceae bacterium]